jgi:hypothetical protein
VSLHVGEIHTEVTPGGGPGGTAAGEQPGEDALEERVTQARRRAEWLACRVAAEAFDD